MIQKWMKWTGAMNSYVWMGLSIVIFFIMLAWFAPWIAPYEPTQIDLKSRLFVPGTDGHILGTDHLGRDLLSRLIYGARVTLLAGVCTALLAMFIGVSIGITSAMRGGITDNVLMRGIDLLMSFPAVLLAILVVAFLGPGMVNAMMAIALVNIPFYARMTRSVTLHFKSKEFIEASRAIGNPLGKTVFKHIIPNIAPYIIAQSMMNIGWIIMETTSLSFLGLGVQPPTADWGSMLGEVRSVMIVAPYAVALPGLCIFIVVIGFNMLGDGLRDWFDPKSRELQKR